jgi:hypothetical protein
MDGGRVAIFAAASTPLILEAKSACVKPCFRGECAAAARGFGEMRQLSSLLSSTRSRIGSRLAQIIAIAAASLPAVGV